MNTQNAILNGNENIDPTDETQTQTQTSQSGLSGPPASRSRTGKIARLPLAIRQQLNQRLQNGERGKDLVQWLNSLPEVQAVLVAQFQGQPIVAQNLSRWKLGGYEVWEEEQTTLQNVTTVFEQATSLQDLAKDGLNERMTLVLSAKMATEIMRLSSEKDGEKRSKIWRELIGCQVLLRRGNLQGERILVEREKLGFRRGLHQRDREAEFWQWIEKEEYRDKILGKLLTPEQNDEEIERRNQETQRKVKDLLGIN
jgi:hypothetical protein